MWQFHKTYFLLALVFLVTELFIGFYMHDAVIRPYGGDFLVVILLYCLLKSFTSLAVLPAAAWVLLFSYAVEISQYFHLVNLLGLQNSRLAKILLGTTFSFVDLLLYTMGILSVIVVESLWRSLKKF
jgi:hypothetical protein